MGHPNIATQTQMGIVIELEVVLYFSLILFIPFTIFYKNRSNEYLLTKIMKATFMSVSNGT